MKKIALVLMTVFSMTAASSVFAQEGGAEAADSGAIGTVGAVAVAVVVVAAIAAGASASSDNPSATNTNTN